MDPQTEVLLKKSADDETTMLLQGIPPAQFGFHGHQTIEKLLKALIAQLGRIYPKTHHTDDLVQILIGCGEVLPFTPLMLSEFDAFAVIWRYDDLPPAVHLDAAKAVETVRLLREYVLRRVMEIDRQNP
jgi:HEPN domain-containing protein